MEFMLTDIERHLTIERQLKFQGTAKIDLDDITTHPGVDREVDQKNVERLCEMFAKDGCQRLDIRNHVTAVVSMEHLRTACRAAGLATEELKAQLQYPYLRFSGHQVHCLHGQHRLKAGEETLAPSDRWWTVDLYLDDISQDLQNALVDEYANEKPPTDGEVYRKIRQYQHESNALFQNRWWSRLSPNKAKRLRQLTSPDNAYLCAAFDGLLPIPGLWNGMSLGSLNSVMALKCDEEIIHYLTHVKNFWATLVNHDRNQMARIDLHTVDSLQLYAPRASRSDRKTVKGKILGGEVFSNFNQTERTIIWENLQSAEACDGIIPSLHTFFRDISYLELCAGAVKRLVVLNKQHPTVRSALAHGFRFRRADSDYPIQTSDTTFRRQLGSSDERITSGYRQIWIYAMRHYPEMAKDIQGGQKANPTRAKARAKADESVVHDMAALAWKLGFRTPQIRAILKQSPDRQIARAALLQARKPDHYYYDSEMFESLIERITGCFALAIRKEGPQAALITGRAIKLKERCGAPQERTQRLDRPYIFLDRLHSATVMQQSLSSLEVRRCVYYAFFGKPSTQRTMRSTPPARPSADEPRSPLFVPQDDSSLPLESVTEHILGSDFGEGPVNDRQNRSETRNQQHQSLEERHRRRQERRLHPQQTAGHGFRQRGEHSPQDHTRGASVMSEAINIDSWDSSGAEDQLGAERGEERPANNRGMDVEMEDRDCTEIDENELLDRAGDNSPGAEAIATVGHSTPGACSDTEISGGQDSRAAVMDAGTGSPLQTQSEQPLVRDRSGLSTAPSRPLGRRAPTAKGQNSDAKWQPYDATQRGDRRAIRRSVVGRDQRVSRGGFTDLEPSAEQLPGPGPLQPSEQYAEPEHQADEPNVTKSIPNGTSLAAGSQDIAPEVAIHPGQVCTSVEQPQNSTEALADDQVSRIPHVAVGSDTHPHQELVSDPIAVGPPADVSTEEHVLVATNTGIEEMTSQPSESQDAAGQEQRVVEQEHQAREATESAEYERHQHEPAGHAQHESLARDKQSDIQRRQGETQASDSTHPLPADPQEGISGEQVALDRRTIADEVEELVHEERVARERADALAQLQDAGAVENQVVVRPVTEIPADLPSLITRLREGGSQLDDEGLSSVNNTIHHRADWGAALSSPHAEPIVPGMAQRRLRNHLDGENLPRSPRRRLRTSPQPPKQDRVRKPQTKNRPTHQDINRAGTRDAAVADELWNSDEDGGTTTVAVELGPSPQDTERYPAVLPGPEQAHRVAIERQQAEDLLFDTPLEDTEDQGIGEVQEIPTSEGFGNDLPPGRRVTITFYAYDRGSWRRTDTVSVSSDNPHEAQNIADHYAQDQSNSARFYDSALRKVAVDECVRAAITDGSFTILMCFGRDLMVTRHLDASVARLLENIGNDGQVIEDEIL
ncbi:hypothetical protein CDV57_01297 [Aspergillus fumigatus]|nr:hypothetical protein KXX06_009912 [Aspergillus fumigatus]KAH2377256.1 hypothetical protein KXV62_000557 [Aspergillus fumigatus]OXN29462.1 hypothetical protein CDV57_01297 [Aspergillus fumigatus]